MPLPGPVVPEVSAATPPRPDGGTPPHVPARTTAALTLCDHRGVFLMLTDSGAVFLRFVREERRIVAWRAQVS